MSALSRKVKVRARFLRSTRLDTDFDATQLIDGFVLHQSGEKIIQRVITEFMSGDQRAFTWTGAYGSGKSTLGLYLSMLLSTNPRERQTLKPPRSAAAFNRVSKILPSEDKPWRSLTMVGQKTDIEMSIREKLLGLVSADTDPDIDLTKLVEKALEAASATHSGLILIVDEFGRHLEYASEENKSLHCLQEIAEIFARSKFPCGIICLLHQAFQDYLPRTERQQRQEWEKIQGRFSDIIFGLSIEESVAMIASAIDGRKAEAEDGELINRSTEALSSGRLALNHNLSKSFSRSLPLHPFVAVMLCLISQQRFGQNERSLFSFLASNEPGSLQDYGKLSEKSISPYYTLDRLYDYLQINLGRGITAVDGLGQRWSDAEECVFRSEQLSEIGFAITKVVSLVEVFGRAANLNCNDDFMVAALPQFTREEIRNTLIDLKERSIIQYRGFKSSYALSLGSDIDLDAELAKLRTNMTLGDIDLNLINSVHSIPVMAKRHYHERGTQRYFNIKIVTRSQLESQKLETLSDSYDGMFLLVLNDIDGLNNDLSPSKIVSLLDNKLERRPIWVASSAETKRIFDQALEVAAIHRLNTELVELQTDRVARRRLATLQQESERELFARVDTIVDDVKWELFAGGDNIEGTENSSDTLSSLASYASDFAYNKSPPLFNELINRYKPSGVATKARRILMVKMIENQNDSLLGIEKAPPELGIYLSILERNILFPVQYTDKDLFAQISQPTEFVDLFEGLKDELKGKASEQYTSASEILGDWYSPPYGIRAGVAPILLLSFILQNQHQLACYVDDRFVINFDEVFIERLSKTAHTVKFRWAAFEKAEGELIAKLAELNQEILGAETKNSPLEIARQLVHYAFKLPNFTKTLSGNAGISLDEETENFRAVLLLADDPLNLLFDKLPSVFGISDLNGASAVDDYISKTRAAVNQLNAVFPRLLDELKEHVIREFPSVDPINPIRGIQKLAGKYLGKSGDPNFERFISALADNTEEQLWVKDLSGMAAQKSVDRWIASDVVDAKIQLTNLANRFRSIIQIGTVEVTEDSPDNIISLGTRTPEKGIQHVHALVMAKGNDPKIEANIKVLQTEIEKLDLTRDEQIAVLTESLKALMSQDDISGESGG